MLLTPTPQETGWSYAWVLHGPEGCAVVSLNMYITAVVSLDIFLTSRPMPRVLHGLRGCAVFSLTDTYAEEVISAWVLYLCCAGSCRGSVALAYEDHHPPTLAPPSRSHCSALCCGINNHVLWPKPAAEAASHGDSCQALCAACKV